MMDAAVLTVSDRGAAGKQRDLGGPAVSSWIADQGWKVVETRIVPDDVAKIRNVVKRWSDRKVSLIVLTGGTGISPKDLTPEAVLPLMEKRLEGWPELMRRRGLEKTPMAALSRQVAGVRKKSLILALPGSPKGAVDSLEAVGDMIEHAVALIGGGGETGHRPRASIKKNHDCGIETGLLAPETAFGMILSNVPSTLGTMTLPLERLGGRRLARSLRARIDAPRFDNSAMDGYAVRCEDLAKACSEKPVALRKVETVFAGSPGKASVKPGEAVRIMTGAPIPPGADAVVMQEQVRANGSGPAFFSKPSSRGTFIRRKGEDLAKGAALLPKGTRLRAIELAALSGQGISRASVYKTPRVGMLSTGDEIRLPGQRLKPGQIFDSSLAAVEQRLRSEGVEAFSIGRVGDRAASLAARVRKNLSKLDVLLIYGGVSVGDRDVSARALGELGFRRTFWKIAMKPGKPLLFGTLRDGKRRIPVFGLPGNPLSTLVCVELFVLPALERMSGGPKTTFQDRFDRRGKSAGTFDLPVGRHHAAFARVEPGFGGARLRLLKGQDSHRVNTAAGADALVWTEVGPGTIREGEALAYRLLG